MVITCVKNLFVYWGPCRLGEGWVLSSL